MCAGGAQPRLEDPAFAKTSLCTAELGMHLSGVARCLSLAETALGRSERWDPDSDENTNASHDNALGPAESWRLG